ncbi:hypothetical protein [Dyadobacter sp. CY343]|uniref:hypothetical protein n=1 Tax=Dyadobacter sp. CY343 TaxID=2907299 RepID=UPI001F3C5C2E|nr:hypothetical protein [Dyadobacter sp. CY343]MCE7061246.1 hypothetical protein [Dyadobacter sp. CY343]
MQKKILLTVWIALTGLACAKATAQGSEEKLQQGYEDALLDSLINYELLKPIHHTLSKTNEFLNKQSLASKAENNLLRLQLRVQKEHYELLLAAERKARRKRVALAFVFGFAAGKLTPPY